MGALKKITCILSFLLFAGSVGFAQDFTARFDSTKILIGNQTLLTLKVKLTDNKKVRFPNLPDTLAPGLEVVRQFATDTTKADNGLLLTKRYLITSFDSGNYVVPQIPVLYFNGSQVDTLLSQPLKLRVNTVVADSTKVPLYGIKANIRAPYTFQEIALFVLAILLLVGLIVLVYLYFRKGKDEPIFSFRKKVIEPPHLIAFRELEQLKQKKLWQNGYVKEYYSELSSILRAYIDEKMEINAMEMTSFEIISAIKENGYTNKAIFERLVDMLNTSDLVKFAKYPADPIENDRAAVCVYDFIDDTKEVSTAAEVAATKGANAESSNKNN